MRDEACESCSVPLMKNKAGEMFCVSCFSYYKAEGDLLVLLRKGQPPRELGLRSRVDDNRAAQVKVEAVGQVHAQPAQPQQAPEPASLISPPPAHAASLQPETAPASPPSDYSAVQYKIRLIENTIMPTLESQLAAVCKCKADPSIAYRIAIYGGVEAESRRT